MRTWDDFTVVSAATADADMDGWTRLPPNGWGALVAYLAGPNWVRGVQCPPGLTTVVRIRGGVEERSKRPATQEDLDMIRDSIDGYLEMSQTPLPPTGVEWEIQLPSGMDDRDLDRGINEAMMDAGDGGFAADKLAVERYMRSLYGDR
ncbi:DUF5956 family protein [Georgenia sp.]